MQKGEKNVTGGAAKIKAPPNMHGTLTLYYGLRKMGGVETSKSCNRGRPGGGGFRFGNTSVGMKSINGGYGTADALVLVNFWQRRGLYAQVIRPLKRFGAPSRTTC